MDLCSIITICKTIQNKCIFPNFNYKKTENNQCRIILKSLLNNIQINFCQRAKIYKSLVYNMKARNWRTGLMRSCFHHCKYLKLHWEVIFETTYILKTQINDVSVKYVCYCPFRDMAVNKKSEAKLQTTEVLDLAKHKIFPWFLLLYTAIKYCYSTWASNVRPEWQRLLRSQRINPGRISSSSIPFSLIFRFSPGATESVSTSSERIPRTSTLCLKKTKTWFCIVNILVSYKIIVI